MNTIAILKIIKIFTKSMEDDLSEYDCFSSDYKEGYRAAMADARWMMDQKIADIERDGNIFEDVTQ